MTTRLPAEELLHVIRIIHAERRAEARHLQDVEPLRSLKVSTPRVPAVPGLRRPARESAGRWLPAPRF